MAQGIYRSEALDRMTSQERLDAPLVLVSRLNWLLFGVIALIIICGIAWSAFTEVPVKVEAKGVLINPEGLTEVVADEGGRIERLLIVSGDSVTVGQPIAILNRTELQRQIDDARAQLTGAQARLSQLTEFYQSQEARQSGADRLRSDTAAETRKSLEARAAYIRARLEKMRGLEQQGFVSTASISETEAELAEVDERLANLGETALKARLESDEKIGLADLSILQQRRIIDEQKRLITTLVARLGEEQIIRSRHKGRLAELKVNPGDVVAPGAALATVIPDNADQKLIAILFVPAAEGKRIESGMTAQIVPTTVERSVYGHIVGTVSSVSPIPSTAKGVRRILQNDQLVSELMAGGAPIEVRIALEQNPANLTGFSWSASEGPKSSISAGSPALGAVVTDKKRVITWLIPSVGGS